MPARPLLRRILAFAGLVVVAAGVAVAIRTWVNFRPAAITLGPETTIYFERNPPIRLRVHEAIHRRQMRDKSWAGRMWSAVRYNFDYAYRLDEEAEAKAGELCLRIHRFSRDLSDYTTARSVFQARTYRAWAWERMGMEVPDRVGEKLRGGAACHEIFRGVVLDLPPDRKLSDDEMVELAAFRFLRAYGSSDRDVKAWRARLDLAGYTEPAQWDLPAELPAFGLVDVGRSVAPPPDTTVDATTAGRALHRLTYYMAERMYVQLEPPPPGYRGRIVMGPGDAEEHTGIPLEEWPQRLLERALDGDLDEAQLAWLDTMSAHPLHQDFETFARAPEADIVGTRYKLPFPEEWRRLVLTDLDPVRTAFRAQWGRAAVAVGRGDTIAADTILRTVVAGALQWIDNAPFEVDVLEGLGFLDEALSSLRELEERSGEVAPWVEQYDSVDPRSWVRGVRDALFAQDPGVVYRAMPALAGDPGIPHAFKRLAYRQVLLGDVCLELREEEDVHREHDAWRASVEVGLIRRESDRQLLELMRRNVRELMEAAGVPPDRICRPGSGLRPGARMAIITTLPGFEGVDVADLEE